MTIEFFGDADAYLTLGAKCAGAIEEGSLGACYNGLRPVGAILYFALGPLLSSDPVTALYIQVALNVATFLLLLRAMTSCVPQEAAGLGRGPATLARAGLLVGALALAMPFLPVPLTDLPAVAFFMAGLALLTRPSTTPAGMVAAGLAMAAGGLLKQNYFPFTAFAFLATLAFGPLSPRSRADWVRLGAAAAGAAVALVQPALVWMHTGHFWPYEPAEGEVFDAVRMRNVVELVAFTIPAKSAYLSTLDTMALSPLSHFCIKVLQGFFAFRPAVYLGAAPAGSPMLLPLTPLLLAKAYLATGLLVAGHAWAAIASPARWRPVVVLSLVATLFTAWIIHVENRYFLLPKLLIVWWAFGWALPAACRRFAASATAAGVWTFAVPAVPTPGLVDWRPSGRALLAYGVVLAVCFPLFVHPDLLHTLGSSYAYLHGHWKDFYEYNRPLAGRNDYLPAIYLLFAAWSVPLQLLGLATDVAAKGLVTLLQPAEALWAKLLLVLLFFAAVASVGRIGALVGRRSGAGWRAAAVFASAPLAVFPVFVMGQYDIVPVLLMVVALHAYFQRRFWLFAALFSLAIPFKYIAAPFFVPLVLLAPVSWRRRLALAAVAALGTLVQVAAYWHSPVFRASLLEMPLRKGGDGRVVFALCVLAAVAVCIACARARWRSDETWMRRAILACCAIAALMFRAVLWHPQWLLFAMPFFALASLDLRRPALWYGAEVIAAVAFGWLVANWFPNNVDVAMVQQGVLGDLFPVLYLRNADFMGAAAMPAMLWLFSAFLFLPALLMVFEGGALADPQRRREADGWIGGRFHAGMAILLLPTLYCLFATEADSVEKRSQARFAVMLPDVTIGQLTRTAGELLEGRRVEQEVVAPHNGLRALAVRFATYARSNSGEVHITVRDAAGAELSAHTVPAARLRDNEFYAFTIPLQVDSAGRRYVVTVFTRGSRQKAAPTVWIDGNPPPAAGQLRIDGRPEPGALNLQLLDARR